MTTTTSSITIKLPDGSQKELPQGATGFDLATSISHGLAKNAVAIEADGNVVYLHRELSDGQAIRILTSKDPEALEVLRHSTAHIMAQAVQAIFPKAKVAIGPTI